MEFISILLVSFFDAVAIWPVTRTGLHILLRDSVQWHMDWFHLKFQCNNHGRRGTVCIDACQINEDQEDRCEHFTITSRSSGKWVRTHPSGMIWGYIRHGWIPYSRSPQDHVGWTNIWHSAMKYISKDRPGKTTDIEPKLPHLSSFGVRTKNFGEVLGNFYKTQATEQRLLSFPSGSACSLNELSFNVFASFHSGSSRNPSRYEGTRESRLRAASLFSVVRRAKRETRKWPRAWLMARFARLAASPLPRTCIALTKSEEKERLLAVY